MADVITFSSPEKQIVPKTYSIDVAQYPDNLIFTINDIHVSATSLKSVANELEKIAQIIRTDVITRGI